MKTVDYCLQFKNFLLHKTQSKEIEMIDKLFLVNAMYCSSMNH